MKSLDKSIKEQEKHVLRVKSYRLDKRLVDVIKAEAKRRKVSESALVRAALKSVFGS